MNSLYLYYWNVHFSKHTCAKQNSQRNKNIRTRNKVYWLIITMPQNRYMRYNSKKRVLFPEINGNLKKQKE